MSVLYPISYANTADISSMSLTAAFRNTDWSITEIPKPRDLSTSPTFNSS